MMDYAIAIRSYRREQIVNEKTLPLLKRGNVPAKRVRIFIDDDAEYRLYKPAIADTPSRLLGSLQRQGYSRQAQLHPRLL